MLQFCVQHFSVVIVLHKVYLLLLELEFGSNFLQHMISFVSFFVDLCVIGVTFTSLGPSVFVGPCGPFPFFFDRVLVFILF